MRAGEIYTNDKTCSIRRQVLSISLDGRFAMCLVYFKSISPRLIIKSYHTGARQFDKQIFLLTK